MSSEARMHTFLRSEKALRLIKGRHNKMRSVAQCYEYKGDVLLVCMCEQYKYVVCVHV